MAKKNWFQLDFQENHLRLTVFSLPQTNHYQTISKLTVKPAPKYLIKEKKYGNEIVVFSNSGGRIKFFHCPVEINKQIDKKFRVGDYSQKKLFHSRFIDGNDKKIKGLATKTIGNNQILNDVIKKLYDFTLDYLTYGKPIDGLYSYRQAYEAALTDCGGFSTLLASLLQSQGIPCRLVVGFLINKKMFYATCYMLHNLSIHAWLECQLPDGCWFPLDPSIEWRRIKGLTKRLGGFGHIPADRLVVSFGEDLKININRKKFIIDILQKPVRL